jgi:hypothetical protein
MVFVVAGQAAVIVLGRAAGWRPAEGYALRPALLAWLGAGVLSAVAYAPYLSSLVSLIQGDGSLAQATQVATASWAFAEAVRALLSGSGVLAAAGGAVAAAFGVVSLWRRHPLATALLIAPSVVTVMALVVMGQPIRPRFFFPLSGAAAVFVGAGFGVLIVWLAPVQRANRDHGYRAGIGVCTLRLVLASEPALLRNSQVPKQDFEGVVPYLEMAEAAGAEVSAAGPACLPFEDYYLKAWPCLVDRADWQAVQSRTGPAVVAFTLADYIENDALREILRTKCPIQRRFPGTLGGGDFVVCEARP